MLKIASFATALVLLALPAAAQSAKGTWLTGPKDSHVSVEPCGANICARVIKLIEPNDPETGKPKIDKNNQNAAQRSRPILGMNILHSMKEQGDGTLKGSVYNPRDGKTYPATVTVSGSKLTLKGCGLGGLVCKTEIWTRLN